MSNLNITSSMLAIILLRKGLLREEYIIIDKIPNKFNIDLFREYGIYQKGKEPSLAEVKSINTLGIYTNDKDAAVAEEDFVVKEIKDVYIKWRKTQFDDYYRVHKSIHKVKNLNDVVEFQKAINNESKVCLGDELGGKLDRATYLLMYLQFLLKKVTLGFISRRYREAYNYEVRSLWNGDGLGLYHKVLMRDKIPEVFLMSNNRNFIAKRVGTSFSYRIQNAYPVDDIDNGESIVEVVREDSNSVLCDVLQLVDKVGKEQFNTILMKLEKRTNAEKSILLREVAYFTRDGKEYIGTYILDLRLDLEIYHIDNLKKPISNLQVLDYFELEPISNSSRVNEIINAFDIKFGSLDNELKTMIATRIKATLTFDENINHIIQMLRVNSVLTDRFTSKFFELFGQVYNLRNTECGADTNISIYGDLRKASSLMVLDGNNFKGGEIN